MRRYACGVLILLLAACGTKVSVGLTLIPHNTEIDQPLGVIRINKAVTENISVDCEHISSAFTAKDVVTLDHCGFYYNF